jgi:hypothetical protein
VQVHVEVGATTEKNGMTAFWFAVGPCQDSSQLPECSLPLLLPRHLLIEMWCLSFALHRFSVEDLSLAIAIPADKVVSVLDDGRVTKPARDLSDSLLHPLEW